MGKHPDFNKFGRGPPKEHPHKIWSKSVQLFKSSQKSLKVHANNNNDKNDDGHRVMARVTLTLLSVNGKDSL